MIGVAITAPFWLFAQTTGTTQVAETYRNAPSTLRLKGIPQEGPALVFLNGILLDPVEDYTLRGNVLIFRRELGDTPKVQIVYWRAR